MATLVGASAFAESRPAHGTSSRGENRGGARREGSASVSRERRGNESRNGGSSSAQSSIDVRGNREAGGRIERNRDGAVYNGGDTHTSESRSYDRNRSDRNRSNGTDRSNAGTYNRNDRNRGSNNNGGNWRNNDSRSRGTYNNNGRYGSSSRYGYRGDPFRYSGRVHRVYPYGGGYRIWLTGCNYPFYIPAAYYNRNRFRIGLSISLGGYYNSLGYYDYYDGYDDRYYDTRTSRGDLRGVVESVDYRRETFVVRNDATGSFVTVVMRDRGRDPVRAGDYVELGGDWSRSGLFEAYRVDIVDNSRNRDDRDR
jgi:hypothetical protein